MSDIAGGRISWLYYLSPFSILPSLVDGNEQGCKLAVGIKFAADPCVRYTVSL